MTRWLPTLSVRRPVTILMVFLALMVLGVIAWSRIPLEMLPSTFSLNRLWVFVPYGDSSPRETEAQIVLPLEEHISTAPGLKEMNSRARADNAMVALKFHRSLSMDEAYNALVDRLERAMSDLPDEVERYWIWKFDPNSEPILWAGIGLPDDVEDEHRLVTEVVGKKLERVPGVGQVETWGVTPRRVFVEYDLDALRVHGVNLGDVYRSLSTDNFQMASGRIVDGGKVRYVRSLARWETIEDLERIPIRDGLVLQDIATITYRPDPSASINHIDGKEGAALAISKESDANTVAVAEAIEEAFVELENDPALEGMKFVKFFSQGDMISESVDELLNTAATGGLCAVIVLFAFLREWRLTLLLAGCIPVTLLLTVTALYFTGHTLNLLTLMGLMLSVGMVVDNAIVVVESIYTRRMQRVDPDTAAIEGTAEVNLAITLSTLTTMVVFLPVILMSGNVDFSFFLGEIGMPVVWALGASLAVALVFTPLTTTLLRDQSTLLAEPRWITWLTERYARGLQWVLHNRTDALMGILALTLVTWVLPFQVVGCEEEGGADFGQFDIALQLDSDFTYSERLEIVETFEDWIDENRERWGVRTHRADLGSGSSYGRLNVHLFDEDERTDQMLTQDEVFEVARNELPEIPGVYASIGWNSQEEEPTNELKFILTGEDTPTLEALAAQARDRLREIDGVASVSFDNEEGGMRELRLRANRDALARYGFDARTVGQTVGFALRANQLPDFHDDGKEVDVIASFEYEDRQDIDRLLDFPMWSPSNPQSVPLRALVDPTVAPGAGTIRRSDRITSFEVTLEFAPGADMETGSTNVSATLDSLAMPQGYEWSYRGRRMDRDDEYAAMMLALLLSITFVYIIMGVLFESFLLPLGIITSIPMAGVGVYWTLYLTGTPLDFMAGVGLVILVGVVVNNGIVLLDLVTRLRREGADRTSALVRAGRTRMRPILMTALTTIFGVLPMAMGTSTFVGMPYAPLGRVVAGGLAAATLLTLFFVPFLYSVLDDMRATGGRWAVWVVAPPVASTDPTASPGSK
ncbi:MAG TPA: hypothetical protein DFR83_15515 [Deltaproteobacteria bacterium]|nr:hypothetical protein [Deltaproteobacteria bacterium]